METSRLQASVNNIQFQLKLEKVSSLAKDTNIKYLEDIVIKLGYDPKNVKITEEIIRRKNVDIAMLKKQLKLPSTKDPQKKEVGQLEKEKEDMFRIIIEKSGHINEMDIEMEKLLKKREQSTQLESIPLTTVPIASTLAAWASTSETITFEA